MADLIARNITDNFERAIRNAPVVFLTGARQVGKSTLVKQLIGSRKDAQYITFDDPNLVMAARRDPAAFLDAYAQHRTVVFDEVQRVPELYLPLKASVDEDRRPGRFILTGSTSALFLPRLADAL
ncbi:MAG: AAA family ATPase, partial [Candidatus Melainabacteria bacterium]|nr:AAA family ATPase [Candidatus Melainabacteria bacterium]